jgi:hypothetical protein
VLIAQHTAEARSEQDEVELENGMTDHAPYRLTFIHSVPDCRPLPDPTPSERPSSATSIGTEVPARSSSCAMARRASTDVGPSTLVQHRSTYSLRAGKLGPSKSLGHGTNVIRTDW